VKTYSIIFLTLCLADAFFIWNEFIHSVWFYRSFVHSGNAWDTAWDYGPMSFRISCMLDPALVAVGLVGYIVKKRPGGLWDLAMGIALVTALCAIRLLTGLSRG
jgi:hypothetical protein